jgi:subtilisin family serine protease
MTVTVSRASTPIQKVNMLTGLEPDDVVAVSRALGWQAWVPQAYEVWWSRIEYFSPWHQSVPSNASVVEVPYPSGSGSGSGSLRASWPQAPAGWHVAQSSVDGGWVSWRNQQ